MKRASLSDLFVKNYNKETTARSVD